MPPKRTRATQSRNTRATTASDATSISGKRSGVSTRDQNFHDDSTNNGDARRVQAPARNGRGARTGRGQREEPEEDYMMTGALPADSSDEAPAPAQKTPGPARPRGRLGRKVVRNDAQSQALEALKRRMEEEQGKKTGNDATAPISAAAALAERKKRRTSGASADGSVAVESPAPRSVHRAEESSPAVAPVSPPRGRQRQVMPSSAVKAQGTPMAENSVLALSKFKRRPRQPSILRMVGATSDVENNDNDNDDTEDLTLNYSLGDFEPDHESTPLHLRKGRKSMGGESEARTSSSRKRKFQELAFEQNEESEIQVPASSPPVLPQNHMVVREPSSEHLYSDASDLPQHVPDTQDPLPGEEEDPLPEDAGEPVGHDTPNIYSETQAPPRSSSSSPPLDELDDQPEATPEAPKNRRSRRQPQPIKATQDEPDSSPASDSNDDTETPARTHKRSTRSKSKAPASKPNAKSKPPKKQRPITTSALASLLPRRRRPQRQRGNAADPFDIPSSTSGDDNDDAASRNIEAQELSSDEDELAHDPPPRQRGKSKSATATTKSKRPADSTRRKGKAAGGGDAATATKKRGAGGRPSKTYGRARVSSDKENQNADGEDVDAEGRNTDGEEGEGGSVKEDLAKVAQKFAEIDKWEMEFESVSAEAGAGASSPWR
ncbi:uncharacterized protein BKA78DRAFT_307423 [Phyllosticta capitalensis]|uniref:uncharacterized protein n=1 Tax=Phyllosticta capitalensis TaxID=121624 RepID=UPI00312DB360